MALHLYGKIKKEKGYNLLQVLKDFLRLKFPVKTSFRNKGKLSKHSQIKKTQKLCHQQPRPKNGFKSLLNVKRGKNLKGNLKLQERRKATVSKK